MIAARAGLGLALLLLAGAAPAQPTPQILLPNDVLVRFKTSDMDGSGGMTQDEAIKGGFSSKRFGAVDADSDQIVTVAEIGAYLAERARVWAAADRDADGSISRSEAESSDELKTVFNNADRDADGILRKQEHEAWSQTSLYQNVDLPYVVPNIINKKF
jgi:hypothetical protein